MAVPTRFSTDWFTHNIPAWEEHLASLQEKPNIHILEIGSFEGRSACWLLQNILTHPTSTLTCVDLFTADPHTRLALEKDGSAPDDIAIERTFDENIRAIGAENRVKKHKGRSSVILPTLPHNRFHAAYIDGSHFARDAFMDAAMAWNLLRDGGLMLFDDYGLKAFPEEERNPRLGIDAFLCLSQGSYDVLHRGWQVIIRKTPHLVVAPSA